MATLWLYPRLKKRVWGKRRRLEDSRIQTRVKMAEGNEAFDGILLSIATQHEGGVKDVSFIWFLHSFFILFSNRQFRAVVGYVLQFPLPQDRLLHWSRNRSSRKGIKNKSNIFLFCEEQR